MNFVHLFDISLLVFFILIWFILLLYLFKKKKKSNLYLILFSLFFVYFFKILDYTLFQFQSLLLLKFFMPQLQLSGQSAEEAINLIPVLTLRPQDLTTSLLNILLFVPFGLFLPLLTSFRMKKIVFLGMIVSIGIELLQFLTGDIARVTFRVMDINDVVFNTLGVILGYVLFVRCVQLSRHLFHKRKLSSHPLIEYFTDRPQIKNN